MFIIFWRKSISFADQMHWVNKHDEKHSENLNLSSFLITILAIVSSYECCTKILMICLFCIFFSPIISSTSLLLINPNWKQLKCVLNLHKNIFTYFLNSVNVLHSSFCILMFFFVKLNDFWKETICYDFSVTKSCS